MIYEIYINYHDEKYSPSLDPQTKTNTKSGKTIIKPPFIPLLPYHIPKDHYDHKKIKDSLQHLAHYVNQNKEKNKFLATRILFTHGKTETRKFLHRAKQFFGNKLQDINKSKNTASEPVSIRNSYDSTPSRSDLFVKNEQLYFQTFRPNFTIKNIRKPPEIRQNRRKTLGIDEADLKNYQESRRLLPTTNKRKENRKDLKDFKKINMKGLAAKICATLESRQKVSTKTLARLMDVKFSEQAISKKKVV